MSFARYLQLRKRDFFGDGKYLRSFFLSSNKASMFNVDWHQRPGDESLYRSTPIDYLPIFPIVIYCSDRLNAIELVMLAVAINQMRSLQIHLIANLELFTAVIS